MLLEPPQVHVCSNSSFLLIILLIYISNDVSFPVTRPPTSSLNPLSFGSLRALLYAFNHTSLTPLLSPYTGASRICPLQLVSDKRPSSIYINSAFSVLFCHHKVYLYVKEWCFWEREKAWVFCLLQFHNYNLASEWTVTGKSDPYCLMSETDSFSDFISVLKIVLNCF